MPITEKQKKFCRELVKDWNGSRAAIAAGYSVHTSREIASNLLTKVNIKEYLEILKKRIAARNDLSVDKIVHELSKIAFANPKKIAKWNADGVVLKDSDELDDDDAGIISEIVSSQWKGERKIAVKLHSKEAALNTLMKYKTDDKQEPKKIIIVDSPYDTDNSEPLE